MKNKTILFSGRFDDVHIGHIMTLQRLARQYDKVIVVILDYPKQFYPIQDRLRTMQTALEGCKGNYEVVVNNVHFGNITREDVE
ncbi:MAG: adenylyltransferase/cytidyltransferase family protein, partial [bacterium]|nr:adenylyltransferase/cytidyltransferase family protein [bacterium]